IRTFYPFVSVQYQLHPIKKFFGYKRFVLTLYQMCFLVLEFGNEYLTIVQRITYGYVESTSTYSCLVQLIHFLSYLVTGKYTLGYFVESPTHSCCFRFFWSDVFSSVLFASVDVSKRCSTH